LAEVEDIRLCMSRLGLSGFVSICVNKKDICHLCWCGHWELFRKKCR